MGRTIALALVLLVGASRAAAQTDDSSVDPERDRRAQQHFQSASAYYETGNYESALREFRASYGESPRPEIQFNIFLCEERLEHLDEAIVALRAYLASGDVEDRDALEERLRNLERRTSGADDAPDRGPAPAPSSSGPPGWAVAALVVSAVGLVSFAVSGSIVLAEDARLSECSPTCDTDETGAIGVAGIVADVSAGIALAGAIVGLIGLLVGSGGEPPASAVAIRARGLGLEGRF